jgi:hypothetical protein
VLARGGTVRGASIDGGGCTRTTEGIRGRETGAGATELGVGTGATAINGVEEVAEIGNDGG